MYDSGKSNGHILRFARLIPIVTCERRKKDTVVSTLSTTTTRIAFPHGKVKKTKKILEHTVRNPFERIDIHEREIRIAR